MDANGGSQPHSVEELMLAGIGWLSLTAEAVDDMADDLARRVGVDAAKMREAVQDVVASWKRDAERAASVPGEATERTLKRLGVVRRDELDDLALRVAQLEHRVRLLEGQST
jgi:polyhydroxyalkanoate synthesis regulator phasin